MAGIYIHIPFCKQACHYCDFHFSTTLKHKDALVLALLHEIKLRKNYLSKENIETIYFGGGTPSLLSAQEIQSILQTIYENFEVSSEVEITLEANPDDLSKEKLKGLKSTAINRMSIGVQSFIDRDLIWMNRAHKQKEAIECIQRTQDLGIENISIDLIYGIPLLTDKEWVNNIHQTLELGVPHISSYALTVEKGTALDTFIQKGKIKPMDEEQSANQFEILQEELKSAGFIHYEISNFCKPNYPSKHNSAYWKGIPYLGVGPSAHSFNKTTRQWNISNNHQYIDSIMRDQIPQTVEILSIENRINEYLMVSLRTMWGIDLKYFEDEFGSSLTQELINKTSIFIKNNWLEKNNQSIMTTNTGKLMADKIASDLFFEKQENQN